MNEYIILNVLLPATGESYEFRVPEESTVEESIRLISTILASVESEFYEDSQEGDLVIRQPGDTQGIMLNPKENYRNLVKQGLLTTGVRLMLA